VPIREKLAKRASKAGLSLSEGVIEGLIAYFDLLRKWNRKISLTSLPVEEEADEAIDRLLIEPVVATKFLPSSTGILLDLGSGGGSPAIPMKLANPGVSLRMVESKTRKAAFLREVVRSLNLESTSVDAVRFEELLVRPGLHDAVDVVTLRAVRVDRKTLTTLQCFLKPGGLVFLFGTSASALPDFGSPDLLPSSSHLLLSQWGSRLEILKRPESGR
jgi:16S rRNA (guanine527-N7)-methyltransferase